MSVEALDKRMTFGMFVKGIGKRIQSVLSRAVPAEEKLDLILGEMEKDVQEKRVTARSIRARMVAISDPETKELEPLERLRARRKKIVELGAKVLAEKEQMEKDGDLAGAKKKAAWLGQLTQEAKALGVSVSSMESTHETLQEAYNIALENYKVALGSYEHVKNNGKAMLEAIKAHQDALSIRDRAKPEAVDASFLDDLTEELEKAQGELRSDKQIDKELDATNPELDLNEEKEAATQESILQEFREAVK